MKKLTLRMRLTLATTLVLTAVCVAVTFASIWNAYFYLTEPIIMAINTEPASLAEVGYDSLEEYYAEQDYFINAIYAMAPELSDEELSAIFDITPTSQVEAVAFTVAAKKAFDVSSIIFMLMVIVGGGALTYWAMGRALRPIKRLTEEIGGMTENELSQPISGFAAHDEIGRLARSFNTMMARLNKVFTGQKQFASAAAHELKTPLSAIRTNIDVLQMDGEPTKKEYRETIEVVKKQALRMSKLVDDLFAMSMQQDYGYADEISFEEMFNRIAEELRPEAEKRGVRIGVGDCSYHSRGNDVMLHRAFANLVENAVKYNGEGGCVDISMYADSGKYVVCVEDTGVGVPADKLPYLFEPFFRVDDSRSRKAGGAGLGLAIVKDSIERHGGTISAKNRPEGGMLFTVTLPDRK